MFDDTLVTPNTSDQFKISGGSAPEIRSFGLSENSGDVFGSGDLLLSLLLANFTSSSILIYDYGSNGIYNLLDGDDYRIFASVTALSASAVQSPQPSGYSAQASLD